MAPPDPRAALDGLARLGVPGPVAVELLELQAASVSSPVTLQANSANMVLVGAEPMTAGALKPEEYDQLVRDIANFLDYAGEPIKAKRQSMGVFVMLFLLVFFAFAYMLKKEYWKDVH